MAVTDDGNHIVDRLKPVLESIDTSMSAQGRTLASLLQNMVDMRADAATAANQANVGDRGGNRGQSSARVSNSSIIANTGVGAGSLFQGMGGLLGGLGSGLGMAAGGIAAILFAAGSMDATEIKDNVVTLLSISDAVEERGQSFIGESSTFFLAMTGLGLGLAAFGIGEGLVGLGQWITDDGWTSTLKKNVQSLLSIGDDQSAGSLGLLVEGGLVGGALAGLGIGLAAFGIGQSLAGLGQWITDTSWAEQVKQNVLTLLSISDGISANIGNLIEGVLFVPAMLGLATGLSVFAVGQAATGLAQFITADNWADQVKQNVLTLLSISDGLADKGKSFIEGGGEFFLAMSGIGAGLAVFGIGSGITGLAELVADWSAGGDWSENIKKNVYTLFSISDDLESKGKSFIGDSSEFLAAMTGIGTGLAVFGIGSGITGLSELLADWSGGGDWSENIKKNVMSLLSISDDVEAKGGSFIGDGASFLAAMTGISAGLMVFSAANFTGTLASGAAKIMEFLTGGQSPVDQVLEIAKNADELEKGSNALIKISDALNKFSSVNVGNIEDIDFTGLAKNLGTAIPFLDILANGGKTGTGWWDGPEFEIPEGKGLLNPNLKLDEMVSAISKINYILGRTGEVVTVPANVSTPQTNNTSADVVTGTSAKTGDVTSISAPQTIINNYYTTNNYGGNKQVNNYSDREQAALDHAGPR